MHNTNNMALASLSPADAPWPELEHFFQLIAGPDGDARPVAELLRIAHQVEADPCAATVDDLLAAAYFYWRSARWNDQARADDVRAISLIISELQRRLRN